MAGADDHAGAGTRRFALTVVFFMLGLLIAGWAARIPAVKASLHLSAGALGVALLGPAVGLLVSTVPTGALLSRLDPRPVMAGGLAIYAASLPLVSFAGGAASLFAVLLVWGFGAGMLDVSMNTSAAALEARAGRRIMSGMHAAYSIGALAGAGSGALAATAGVSVGWNLSVDSAVAALAGGAALATLGRAVDSVPAVPAAHAAVAGPGLPVRDLSDRNRRLPPPRRRLLALAVIAFASFLAEGAISDWSAVYLRSTLGSSAGVAALGYTCFSLAMTAGRLCGDRLGHAVGSLVLVRCSTLVGAVGLGVALAAGAPAAALSGFAVLGLGLSFVVPLVFSAAATLGTSSATNAGPSLALVTACGYVGLMSGPPLIGGVADAVGLGDALVVIVVVLVVVAVLASSLAPPARRAAPVSVSRQQARA